MRDRQVLLLKNDIKNPKPDRRSKDWNKLPALKAGRRFLFNGEDYLQSASDKYEWEHTNSDLAKLILANSERVTPETVRELMYVYDCEWGGDEILRMLIKLGKVKPEDFAAVTAAYENDENF